MPLTKKQRDVVRLRNKSLSWSKIAGELGTTKSSVNSSYRAAQVKIARGDTADVRTLEVKRPADAAAALDVMTDPGATINKAAKLLGLPASTLRGFMRRMKLRNASALQDIREVKAAELVKLLDDRALKAISYINDDNLAGASPRDLAVVSGIMIDKSQLLQGQPTQIISHEERKKLNDLIPLLVNEAKRRGITIEGMVVPGSPVVARVVNDDG